MVTISTQSQGLQSHILPSAKMQALPNAVVSGAVLPFLTVQDLKSVARTSRLSRFQCAQKPLELPRKDQSVKRFMSRAINTFEQLHRLEYKFSSFKDVTDDLVALDQVEDAMRVHQRAFPRMDPSVRLNFLAGLLTSANQFDQALQMVKDYSGHVAVQGYFAMSDVLVDQCRVSGVPREKLEQSKQRLRQVHECMRQLIIQSSEQGSMQHNLRRCIHQQIGIQDFESALDDIANYGLDRPHKLLRDVAKAQAMHRQIEAAYKRVELIADDSVRSSTWQAIGLAVEAKASAGEEATVQSLYCFQKAQEALFKCQRDPLGVVSEMLIVASMQKKLEDTAGAYEGLQLALIRAQEIQQPQARLAKQQQIMQRFARVGYFEAALELVAQFPCQKTRDTGLCDIISEQALQHHFDDALENIARLPDSLQKLASILKVAEAYYKTGERNAAARLTDQGSGMLSALTGGELENAQFAVISTQVLVGDCDGALAGLDDVVDPGYRAEIGGRVLEFLPEESEPIHKQVLQKMLDAVAMMDNHIRDDSYLAMVHTLVWLNDLKGAEEIATLLVQQDHYKDIAYGSIAKSYLSSAEAAKAKKVTLCIQGPGARQAILFRLAEFAIDQGDIPEARRLITMVDSLYSQALFFTKLSLHYLDNGDLQSALGELDHIPLMEFRFSQQLNIVTHVQVSARDQGAILDVAEATATAILDIEQRASSLLFVAKARADIGDLTGAERSLDKARERLELLPHQLRMEKVLSAIAKTESTIAVALSRKSSEFRTF